MWTIVALILVVQATAQCDCGGYTVDVKALNSVCASDRATLPAACCAEASRLAANRCLTGWLNNVDNLLGVLVDAILSQCDVPLPRSCPVCSSNECSQLGDSRNKCRQQGTSHRCTCEGTGYGFSEDLTTCITGGSASVVCGNNECSQLDYVGNQCLPQGDGYRCVCGNGWNEGNNGCYEGELRPDIVLEGSCSSDPCSSYQEVLNECMGNRDGSWLCFCSGAGWSQGESDLSCKAPAETCISDECSTSLDRNNRCIAYFDGTYVCECGGTGFVHDLHQLRRTEQCVLENTACVNNECGHETDIDNICVVRNDGTGYSCQCDAGGWTAEAGGLGCIQPQAQCRGDECSVSGHRHNVCEDQGDGTFECLCSFGWATTPDGRGCLPPEEQCRADECLTSLNRFNDCYDNKDGTFVCACDGDGWDSGFRDQFCIPPEQQCTEDQCLASVRGNLCTDNGDATYTCTCDAEGYMEDRYGECVLEPKCYDNECGQQSNARNRCFDGFDGTWTCSCGGTGWTLGPAGDSCIPPRSQCGNDECAQSAGKNNQCEDLGDGTYVCLCREPGFSDVKDRRSCLELPPSCVANECSSNEAPDNKCTARPEGGYRCTCAARGWSRQRDGLGCDAPPARCLNNECSTDQAGNICKDNQDGTFVCDCKAKGWRQGRSSQSCDEPLPQCRGNECSVREDKSNVCVDGNDGSFTCQCAGLGWTVSNDGLSCVPPQAQCLDNECKSLENRLNVCTDLQDGTFSCSCGGGWLGTDDQSCRAPSCQDDVCATTQNADNRCTVVGESYECDCSEEFTLGSTATGPTCRLEQATDSPPERTREPDNPTTRGPPIITPVEPPVVVTRAPATRPSPATKLPTKSPTNPMVPTARPTASPTLPPTERDPNALASAADGAARVIFVGYATWSLVGSNLTVNDLVEEPFAPDRIMEEACSIKYKGAHAAVTQQLLAGLVFGLPEDNDSGFTVFPKCSVSMTCMVFEPFGGARRRCVAAGRVALTAMPRGNTQAAPAATGEVAQPKVLPVESGTRAPSKGCTQFTQRCLCVPDVCGPDFGWSTNMGLCVIGAVTTLDELVGCKLSATSPTMIPTGAPTTLRTQQQKPLKRKRRKNLNKFPLAATAESTTDSSPDLSVVRLPPGPRVAGLPPGPRGLSPGGRRLAQSDDRRSTWPQQVADFSLDCFDQQVVTAPVYAAVCVYSARELAQTCSGSCGSKSKDCWCDTLCTTRGDCCKDYSTLCLSPVVPSSTDTCQGHCGHRNVDCWCDSKCVLNEDCCQDRDTFCSALE